MKVKCRIIPNNCILILGYHDSELGNRNSYIQYDLSVQTHEWSSEESMQYGQTKMINKNAHQYGVLFLPQR